MYRTASVQFTVAGLSAVKWTHRAMHNIDLTHIVSICQIYGHLICAYCIVVLYFAYQHLFDGLLFCCKSCAIDVGLLKTTCLLTSLWNRLNDSHGSKSHKRPAEPVVSFISFSLCVRQKIFL